MKLPKLTLSTSFLDLTKGHLVSQVIGAVCSVFIAKIYGASALGVFSVYFTLTMILSSFNTLRLDSLLFLEIDVKARLNNTIGLLSVVLTTSIFLGVLSCCLPDVLVTTYFVSRKVLFIAVFSAMLQSIRSLFQSVVLLSENYKKLKKAKVLFTVVRYLFQFILFLLTIHFWGLIIGYIIAIVIVSIFLYIGGDVPLCKLDFLKFKKTIFEYKDLLKFALPGDIINTVAVNIFPVLLISIYGKEITGNYFMAFLILTIPLTFLQSVVSPIYFQKSRTMVLENNLKTLLTYTNTIVKRIFLIVSAPLLISVFFGEEIIVFVFGESWRATGVFIQIFSLLFAIRVLYSTISSLEEVFKKNNISLIVNLYFVLVLFLSLYLGKNYFSIFEIATSISVLMSLGYLFLLIYFVRLIRKKAELKTF